MITSNTEELLTSKGVNEEDFFKEGDFHRLVARRNIKGMRKWLSSSHCDVLNDIDTLGLTPLHIALLHCDVSVLSMLLHPPSAPEGMVVKLDFNIHFDDLPPLFLLFQKSQFSQTHGEAIACLKLILEDRPYDLNIDDLDSTLCTALHMAARFGDIDFAHYLLKYNANPLLVNRQGEWPAHLTIDSHSPGVLSQLIPTLPDLDLPPFSIYTHMGNKKWQSLVKRELTYSIDNLKLEDDQLEHILGSLENHPHFSMEDICLKAYADTHKHDYSHGFTTNSEFKHSSSDDEVNNLSDHTTHTYAIQNNYPQNFTNNMILSLLRRCIQKRSWNCLFELLKKYSTILLKEKYELATLTNIAIHFGYSHEFNGLIEIFQNRTSLPQLPSFATHDSLLFPPSTLSTFCFTHSDCFNHLRLLEPMDIPIRKNRITRQFPENPTRLEVLTSKVGVLRSDVFYWLNWKEDIQPASLADVLRVHNWSYIMAIKEKISHLTDDWNYGHEPLNLIDGDTPITSGSWDAALSASGSVIEAVDAVCTGRCRNAFCAIRPPGHHLGSWGAAQIEPLGEEDFAYGSQGFCLLNNVAIGAGYAKYNYHRKGIKNIAIIDFDVHHGNGTEQIIRNVGPKTRMLEERRFNSTYYQPIIAKTHPILSWKMQFPSWMGWYGENDPQELFFASIHAYNGQFYPGTGDTCHETNGPIIINVGLEHKTTSHQFRVKFHQNILTHLLDFKPDLIFISAGFDGHFKDNVAKGFTAYTEADFEWATQQLIYVANTTCDGRVVSVLEGGYNTKTLTLSPFARSVMTHVQALHFTSPFCTTTLDSLYQNDIERPSGEAYKWDDDGPSLSNYGESEKSYESSEVEDEDNEDGDINLDENRAYDIYKQVI